MSSLESALAYFKEHQADLAEEHHGKFVLIHDQSTIGFYDSELDAYGVAKNDKGYAAGTFLIRKCVMPEEETTQVFHSRVAM